MIKVSHEVLTEMCADEMQNCFYKAIALVKSAQGIPYETPPTIEQIAIAAQLANGMMINAGLYGVAKELGDQKVYLIS